MGRELSEGRAGAVEAELALSHQANAGLRQAVAELTGHVGLLDEENEELCRALGLARWPGAAAVSAGRRGAARACNSCVRGVRERPGWERGAGREGERKGDGGRKEVGEQQGREWSGGGGRGEGDAGGEGRERRKENKGWSRAAVHIFGEIRGSGVT